jgi:uncharacterized protein (DUF2252 family)
MMIHDDGEQGPNPAVEPAPVPPKLPHPTPAERVARGKAARSQVPREDHAGWKPPADRADPVDLLEAQAKDRVPELVPIRYGRMLVSPFAFYRGGAAIMAADLAHTPQSGIRAQICGDAHVSNFGGFASPERDLVFDLNDFDETLPGPWEWDVKRLATSLEIAGRLRDCNAKECRSFGLAALAAYRLAMQEFAAQRTLDVWYSRLDMAGVRRRWGAELRPNELQTMEKRVSRIQTRDNIRPLEKLTASVNGELRIASHPKLVVPLEELLPDAERQNTHQTMRDFVRRYRRSLPGNLRNLLEDFEYTHMARKVVGVGSVGMRCWIVLFTGRDETDVLFLQFKEAQASVLEAYCGKSEYADHGQRVVAGQRLMQAAGDIFLGWERIRGVDDGIQRDFYVRQLWDWKFSADVETMPLRELMVYGQMCGWTLARAHARSGDRIAIASYLGKGASFDHAVAEFATEYADQNERDYRALRKAVENGRVKAESGV